MGAGYPKGLTDFDSWPLDWIMAKGKKKAGRPKHVAKYFEKLDARDNFFSAMNAVLHSSPKYKHKTVLGENLTATKDGIP
jgi:hypothetical protein